MDRFTGRMSKLPAPAQLSSQKHGLATPPGKAALAGAQLTARVEALEAAVRQLQDRAIQQEPDGRLHLPVATRLRIRVGGTSLSVGISSVEVEANGRLVFNARPGASPDRPATAPTGSIQQMAASQSQGGWQSAAAQSGVSNPRRPGAATVIDLAHP